MDDHCDLLDSMDGDSDLIGFQDDGDPFMTVEPQHAHRKRKKPESRTEEDQVCILVRADKKPIPFNFYNKCQAKWNLLSFLNPSTLSRNSKGTIIKASILQQSKHHFLEASKTFELENIQYEAFSPKKPSPYQGEITFDLLDLEDKNILRLQEEELKALLQTPGDQNGILSVTRLYPRKTITTDEELKEITSMRVSIEFTNRTPDRVFFDHVSIPIIPFILPPKRCFICQRYGHSSLSCRRKTTCSICAENHFHTQCTITNKDLFKCSSCHNNHKASSSSCNYYKAALKIAAQLQESRITQIHASREYAKLYNSDSTSLNGPSTRLITPSPCHSLPHSSQPQGTSTQPFINQTPGVKNKIPHSSMKTRSSQPPQSTSSGSIPPAQMQRSNRKKNEEDEERRPRRGKSTSRVPRHRTKTYAGILDGSRWLNRSDSSEAEIDIDLPSITPQTTSAQMSSSIPPVIQATSQSETESENSPEPQPKDIFSLLKQLFVKITEWLMNKFTSFLGNSPLQNVVQSLISTLLNRSS